MSTQKAMNEVIISSDINSNNVANDTSGTIYVWSLNTDTTGNNNDNDNNELAHYKKGATGCTARGLCMLKKDFLVSASHNQSEILFWPLSNDVKKDEQYLPTRMEVVSKVSSLAVSPDGLYCVAGIAQNIYIWSVFTGRLLSVNHRHYQDVVCIKFADNLTFVTGGEDNLVMVWSMVDILTFSNSNNTHLGKWKEPSPVYIWRDHALPITDIHVGAGGIRARIVSSSLDQTCKFWDLATGRLLCSLKFSESLLSVAMNMAENRLYAGGTSGKIYVMDLSQGSAKKNNTAATKSPENNKSTCGEKSKFYFLGHQKRVTCLSVSASGQFLVSGSDDCTVKVWNTSTGQCIRTLVHNGAVTNAYIVPLPPSLFEPKNALIPTQQQQQATVVFPKSFENDLKPKNNLDPVLMSRHHFTPQHDKNNDICGEFNPPFQSDIFATVLSAADLNSVTLNDGLTTADDEESKLRNYQEKTEIITRLQKEINQIKEANDKLFAFSVAQVLK